LLGRNGSTPRVESLAMRSAEETVYTLEVDGDHCFRVGEQGLLVHNTSAPCCSGLSYTGAPTPIMTVTVGGRIVPIYGAGQKTGKINCPNSVNKHRQASVNIAQTAAATGSYQYLTLDRSWSTATGGASSDARRPDVIGVRCDGLVLAWEVISIGDDPLVLEMRLQAGYATLPPVNQGVPVAAYIFVVPPMC
jgi:hypothetical protein